MSTLQRSWAAIDRDIAALSGTDPRTVKRVRLKQRVRYQSGLAIQAAIVDLGLSHLLAEPMTDPDTSEDLGR
jgi:hypothetical protein